MSKRKISAFQPQGNTTCPTFGLGCKLLQFPFSDRIASKPNSSMKTLCLNLSSLQISISMSLPALWPRVAPLQDNRLPRMNLTVSRIPLLTPQMPSLKSRKHVPVDVLHRCRPPSKNAIPQGITESCGCPLGEKKEISGLTRGRQNTKRCTRVLENWNLMSMNQVFFKRLFSRQDSLLGGLGGYGMLQRGWNCPGADWDGQFGRGQAAVRD